MAASRKPRRITTKSRLNSEKSRFQTQALIVVVVAVALMIAFQYFNIL